LTLGPRRSAGIPTLNGERVSAEARRMAEEEEFLREVPTRRVATRYIVRIPVAMRVGQACVEGAIVDVSDSGLRLECSPPRVAPGTAVQIDLRCFKLPERVTMLAKFVRETPAGCALRFVDPDPFLRVFVKLARLHDASVGDRLEKLSSDF
jgi:hypothetical protein